MTERGMERERHTMKRKCIFFTLVELIIVIVCTCILFLAWTLYEEYVLHPKELDRELVCACYLQQIYKACHQYSLSNDGRFPCARSVPDPKTSEWASKTDCCEDFELLRTQYLDDSKMFLCPDNEFGERAQKGVSLSNTGPKFNVTYAWYRGVSTRDDPLTTIACDGLTNHKGKDKRLFHPKERGQFVRLDGSVGREPVDVFFRKEILEEEHSHVVGGALLVVFARFLGACTFRGLGLGGYHQGKDYGHFNLARVVASVKCSVMGTSP